MATVLFQYVCARDPVGYVTSLGVHGLSKPLAQDLGLMVPFNGSFTPAFKGLQYKPPPPNGTVKVVGILQQLSWSGGISDPIKLEFFVSGSNATQLYKAVQGTAAATINALGWWIGGSDPTTKAWFDQACPQTSSVTGKIGQGGLTVDRDTVTVSAVAGLRKITMTVSPASNCSYTLLFAPAASRKIVKNWGLVVGTL